MNDYMGGGGVTTGAVLATTGGAFESEIALVAGLGLLVGSASLWFAAKFRRKADVRSSAE